MSWNNRMNKRQLETYIVKKMRWLVALRRYVIALRDSVCDQKKSYSQHREDVTFQDHLKGMTLTTGIYIDVGANHPTLNSNTYLFYRNGCTGILVEPDTSNCRLLNRFRPKDTTIKVLVGEEKKLVKFYHSYNSALSSVNTSSDSDIQKTELIPQVTVDDITDNIKPLWVFLLSVDAEGVDYSVLMGAKKTLERTYLVCVENNGEDFEKIDNLLKQLSFNLVDQMSVNSVYMKSDFIVP